jgi:glucose/arabinose dehydrogenase
MGDNQPPSELNRADKPGVNFGFLYYGGGKMRANEYKDQTPPADATLPQVEMDAHAADLGMTFYTGRMFPQKYRGGIFSAQHGSWNRTTPIGARVMLARYDPKAVQVDFVQPDVTSGRLRCFDWETGR